MDELKGVVPNSCTEKKEMSLFGDATSYPCRGCQEDGFLYHMGKYCLVKDWSKSVAEIDQQLYAKYGLTPDEIAFIDSTIKPME